MSEHRFYIARDPYDSEVFHLLMEMNLARKPALQYHVSTIFEDHLFELTVDHIEDNENHFMRRVKDLEKGQRIEVNIKLSIAEDD